MEALSLFQAWENIVHCCSTEGGDGGKMAQRDILFIRFSTRISFSHGSWEMQILTFVNVFHFLPRNRHCSYTLGAKRREEGEMERESRWAQAEREVEGRKRIPRRRVLLLHNKFIFDPSMHIYEQLQWKIAFLGDHIQPPLIYSSGLAGALSGSQSRREKRRIEGCIGEKHSCGGTFVTNYSPVTWSTRMREVMMRPYWEKSCSSSFWVIVFGKPLTYKFASLMEAELGRA